MAQAPNLAWSRTVVEEAECSTLLSESPLSKEETGEAPRSQPANRRKLVKERAAIGASANAKAKGSTREQLLARSRLALESTGILERLAALRMGAVHEK